MVKRKVDQILIGATYIENSMEMFLTRKIELVWENPKVFLFGFTHQDKIAIQRKDAIREILKDMAMYCPLFTAAKSGILIHLHNFGASIVAKFDSEYFVRKIAFEDRRAVMFWARENCEISDTRTSEFQLRSAADINVARLNNVIEVDF